MTVLVPYVEDMLHPRVVPAIRAEGYEPILYRVEPPPGPNSYPAVLRHWLLSGKRFCVVEHDIEVTAGSLRALEDCTEPWCWHGYNSPYWEQHRLSERYRWLAMLGCTRFSGVLGALLRPQLDTWRWMRDWDRRDWVLSRWLAQAGLSPHLHGEVISHHPGHCACWPDCAR